MKNFITIIFFVLPISLFAQSLNENAYLTYYLGNNLQESSLGSILGRTYDGISKAPLSRNIPADWVSGYSLNHLPITARYSDFITPFGRSYISVSGGSRQSTDISFVGSNYGEMDASLVSRYKLNKSGKINTSLLLNYHSYNGNRDKNEDQFLDLNQKQKLFAVNNWFFNVKNYRANITAYHLRLDEIGGQINFNKNNDYLTTNAYGMGMDLNNTGVAISNDWSFKNKETQQIKGRLFIDGEVRLSDMTQFFGLNEYKGKETHINAYAGYAFSKGFTDWEFGAHFRNEQLEETFADSQLTNFNVSIPGIYGRMETSFGYRIKLQADLRANYHTDDQFLIHPGLKLTYVPADRMAMSVFAGNGTRYARTITENNRFLFSNREVVMNEKLNPERAWHYGLSYRWSTDTRIEPLYDWYIGGFSYYMLFYHNIYQNLNIVDISDDNLLVFKNHDGRAFKTSLNNRFTFSPFRATNVTFMHRYDVFKMNDSGEMMDRLYHPRSSFMFAMDFKWQSYVRMNTQVHVIGKTPTSNKAYTDGYAPKRKRWDVSFVVPVNQYLGNFNGFKKFDVILGFDNITKNKLDDVIIDADDPFGPNMDGGITNGNALGSRIYGGVKIGF